ncbi:hypothetical protein BHE74_00005927 [Ensete ventricosum]|nr:hypothetical protein BHE74_00005927 [Ensete ventricosum]
MVLPKSLMAAMAGASLVSDISSSVPGSPVQLLFRHGDRGAQAGATPDGVRRPGPCAHAPPDTGSPAAPSGVTPRRREEVTESFPPVVCGGLFLVFPAPHNEINDA